MLFQSRADKLYEQGMNYLNQEKYPEAIKLFSQVIEIDGSMGAYINRGFAYGSIGSDILINDGKKEQANEYFHNAIKDFTAAIHIITFEVQKSGEALDTLADLYFKRANTYFFLEKPKEAIDDLNEAIKIRGKNPDYYIKRGFIYAEWIGDASTGLEDYSKAIAISPSAEGYLYRAWANFDLKKLDRAKGDFYSAVRLDSNARNAKRGFTPYKRYDWDEFTKDL